MTAHATCYHIFEAAHGFVAVAWRGERFVSLRLPAPHADDARAALLRREPAAAPAAPAGVIAETVAAIGRYYDGAREDFDAAPVDLGRQEPFFTRVYAHVRTLGWGDTTTYGDVARALNATPEAARSVGQAMARNPVPLIVPCHRVLAAGGRIGGFTAPGGALAKARMLEMERAIAPDPQATFDF